MSPIAVTRAILLLVLLLHAVATPAQWTTVAPGFEYRDFSETGPNRVCVTRMDRATTTAIIDSVIATDNLISGRERTSSMAARMEGVNGFWGEQYGKYRYDVVAAINGDFFNTTTGEPQGGQIVSGIYAKRFGELGGYSGFAYRLNRTVFLGGCVAHPAAKNVVAYPATAQSQELKGINRTRTTNDLVLFTPQYSASTGTDASGVEVLVEMTRWPMILPAPSYAAGTVRALRSGAGNSSLPFNHVVLSGTGTAATALLANATLGSEVRISEEIKDYQGDCNTPASRDWTKTYAVAGGNFTFLRDGVVQPTSNPGLVVADPRTAVAFNAAYIYFVVVDGRTAQSIGMDMATLAAFCIGRLAATDGVNMDGGGSSTLWVDGTVRNSPSDAGGERTVANGLLMVSLVENPAHSIQFVAEQRIKTTSSVTVRRGPGTNWPSVGSLGPQVAGTVRASAHNGVFSTGDYWWNTTFDLVEGWLPESAMASIAGVPDWQLY